MKPVFARVEFDLFCDWKKQPPIYRLYVNHELFNERTYIWTGTKYLQEILQMNAVPGVYKIRIENLGSAVFKIRNLKGIAGPVKLIDSTTFEILDESK